MANTVMRLGAFAMAGAATTIACYGVHLWLDIPVQWAMFSAACGGAYSGYWYRRMVEEA